MSDYIAASLDTVAAYFGGLAQIASGRVGWPDFGVDFDLSAGPVVSLTFATETGQDVNHHPVDDPARALWVVRKGQITAQLDLWARYVATRDEAAGVLEGAFHNDAPHRLGLHLTQLDYFDQPLIAYVGRGTNMDGPSSAPTRTFRRRWTLQIHADRVVETQHPRQQRITQAQTVDGVLTSQLTQP